MSDEHKRSKNGEPWLNRWEEKRLAVIKLKARGLCIIDIRRVGRKTIRLEVIAPFNYKFIQGARGLCGSWRPRTGVWTFDARTFNNVKALCESVYGKVTVAGHKGLLEGLVDAATVERR